MPSIASVFRWVESVEAEYAKWQAAAAPERKRMVKDWIKQKYDSYQDSR